MRLPRPFRTLRGHLLLLACLATLPAFLFLLMLAVRERTAALSRAEQEARFVAHLASREHTQQVLGAEALLGRLALLATTPASEDLPRLLPPLLQGHPQLANLGLLNPDGTLAYSVMPPAALVDMHDDAAFREALVRPGPALGRYQIGQIVQRPVLILAQSVRDSRGGLERVVFAALDLRWLDQLGQEAALPQGHTLLILDTDGQVLARSGDQGAAREGQRMVGLPSVDAQVGMAKIVGADGRTRLFVTTSLKGAPDLRVAVGLPLEILLGAANRAFVRTLGALVLLTLLAAISALVAADLSVLRELRQLAKTTRRFGEGNLKARALVPSIPGEIQELALAFNGMTEALESRHQEAIETEARLRALGRSLQEARETEGARIARELHDHLGQELTSLKLEVGALKRRLSHPSESPSAAELGAWADQASTRIDASVDFVRRVSSELHPSVLDRLGLPAALEWLLREFERRTGLKCDLRLEAPDLGERLDPRAATALFRITQEALTNVARHAGATKVTVSLDREGANLCLKIRDDGTGFSPEEARRKGSLGLLAMEERAALAEGSLTLRSSPGSGSEVEACIPSGPSSLMG